MKLVMPDISKCIDRGFVAFGFIMIWFGGMMTVFQPSLEFAPSESVLVGLMSMFGGLLVIQSIRLNGGTKA